jgi:hypothetical protein
MMDAAPTGRRGGNRLLWGCLGGAVLLCGLLAVVVGLAWHFATLRAPAFAIRREALVSIVRSRATVEEARQRRHAPGRLVAKPADPYSLPEMQGVMNRDRERIKPSMDRAGELLVFADDQAVEILLIGADGRAIDYAHYLR